LILIVAAGAMGGFANMFSLGQEVCPEHTGKIVGIGGAIPWVVLSILQPIIGALRDELGTFTPMLIAIAFVPIIGAFVLLAWPRSR
jgi:MFS-type transporter involved in bile tolerance (Atg22 family)